MTRGGGAAALAATAFVLSMGAFIRGGLDLPIRSHPKPLPKLLMEAVEKSIPQFNRGECEEASKLYAEDAVSILDPEMASDFKIGRAPIVANCRQIYEVMTKYDTYVKDYDIVKYEYQGDDIVHVVSKVILTKPYSAGPLVYDRFQRIGEEWLITTEMYASGTKIHIPPSDGHKLPAWIEGQVDKPASSAIPYWGHWHKFLKYYYAKDAVLWRADATGWGGAFGDRKSVLDDGVREAGPFGDQIQYHIKKYTDVGNTAHTLWTATMAGKPLTSFYARFELDPSEGKYYITSEVLSIGS
eukprot:Hpha_TRINITY_DN16751_c2_g3::TRINITY_DN16751_c2_g3_i1::g.79271::m.79271